MRQARSGHLNGLEVAPTYGAKTPMLGPYFAAKAAQDSLAQTVRARADGVGNRNATIVSPGVFTKGTNHFPDASQPGNPDVASQYEQGPTKGIGEETMAGTEGFRAPDADPKVVADALVELAAGIPRGKKPFRMFPDPSMDGGDVGALVIDNNKVNTL